MTWAERNSSLLPKIHAYCSDFNRMAPPPFAYFEKGSQPIFPIAVESDRGTALLLLYCALHHHISEDRLMRFLAYLWKEYDTDIFRLNRMPFEDLQNKIQRLNDLAKWPLWPKAPGILRSVCDFFYRHGPLLAWVREIADAEKCVEMLAEEIFLMGKSSEFRPRPRYFLWLLAHLKDARPEDFWSPRTLLCPTPGHGRFIREFGPLKNRRQVPWNTPQEKLAYFNRFYQALSPGRSYLVFAGLDAFLKPDPEFKWACRKMLGGCAQCALVETCSGKEL